MTRKAQSDVARRREQIRKQKERQNRLIRLVSSLLLGIALLVVVFFVRQAMTDEEESSTMTAVQGSPMQAERPLAELEPMQRNGYYDSYPETVIDSSKTYDAVIRTEKGDITVRLFADEAPKTVNSFVFLANQGFYDNLTFHRVMEDFMAQGGDPTGRGSGGPGYQFEDETNNGLLFDRPSLLAMANAGPNTNGSQFFITFVPTSWLNGKHTIFGEVTEGEEVLSQITRRQPGAATPGDTIERIDIYESE